MRPREGSRPKVQSQRAAELGYVDTCPQIARQAVAGTVGDPCVECTAGGEGTGHMW